MKRLIKLYKNLQQLWFGDVFGLKSVNDCFYDFTSFFKDFAYFCYISDLRRKGMFYTNSF